MLWIRKFSELFHSCRVNEQVAGLAFGSFVLYILYTYICIPCLDFIKCWKFMRSVWLVVAYRLRTSSRRVTTASVLIGQRMPKVTSGFFKLYFAGQCITLHHGYPTRGPRPRLSIVYILLELHNLSI